MAVFLATGLTADLAVDLAECLFVGLTTGFVLALVTGVVLLFAGVVLILGICAYLSNTSNSIVFFFQFEGIFGVDCNLNLNSLGKHL